MEQPIHMDAENDPMDDGTLFGAFAKRLGYLVLEVGHLEMELLELVKQLHRHEIREANGPDPADDELLRSLLVSEEEQWASIESKRMLDQLSALAERGESLTERLPVVAEAFDDMKASDDHLTWANFAVPYQESWPQTPADLFGRVRLLAKRRNELVHASWKFPLDRMIGFRADRTARLIVEIRTTSAELDLLTQEAGLLRMIAFSLRFGLGVTLGPRPRRELDGS